MTRRTIACRKQLSGNDKRSNVGVEILEEVGEAVEESENGVAVGGDTVVPDAHDGENDREGAEAQELDGFSPPFVDEEERGPVANNPSGPANAVQTISHEKAPLTEMNGRRTQ